MLRFRFGSGLILGLVLGIPAGAVIALLLAPAPSATDRGAAATTLQVQELTRKLEAARDDRQRADTQLEQFQKLAEQMTASFNNLEQRFKALQEEQRLQEAQAQHPAPPPPVVKPQVVEAPPPAAPQLPPPADTPTMAAPAAGEAAPPPVNP